MLNLCSVVIHIASWLTLSNPVVSSGYTSECSAPYWRHTGTLALRTERPSARMSKKIKIGGLDQYGAERFSRLVFAAVRKQCGTERVNVVVRLYCMVTQSVSF